MSHMDDYIPTFEDFNSKRQNVFTHDVITYVVNLHVSPNLIKEQPRRLYFLNTAQGFIHNVTKPPKHKRPRSSIMCPSSRTLRQETDPRSELKPAFEVLDVDRDGKISYNDLQMFYGGFSSTDGEEDVIGTMISVADSNRDGFVEYNEFERVLDGCRQPRREGGGIMEDVFRIMDTDGDGKLSYGDLKNFMTWAGFSANDEEIRAMIKFGGGDDNDDGVSYDGLLKILAI